VASPARGLMDVHLTDELDAFVWKLTTSGSFAVKSLYVDHMNDHTRFFENT
jgi:hypothetical protein